MWVQWQCTLLSILYHLLLSILYHLLLSIIIFKLTYYLLFLLLYLVLSVIIYYYLCYIICYYLLLSIIIYSLEISIYTLLLAMWNSFWCKKGKRNRIYQTNIEHKSSNNLQSFVSLLQKHREILTMKILLESLVVLVNGIACIKWSLQVNSFSQIKQLPLELFSRYKLSSPVSLTSPSPKVERLKLATKINLVSEKLQ